jgi:cytochrome P450
MLVITSVIVVCLCLLIHVMRKNKNNTKYNLPPSLPSVPLLGSLPFFKNPSESHKFFKDQVKKYGSVYSFMAGSSYMVVINGHEAIREALVKKAQDFAGRKQINIDKMVWNKEGRGIIFQEGETWKKNRVHTMAILKQFGFGERTIMEEVIHRVLTGLVEHIKTKNGISWDPRHVFQITALNIITQIMFGNINVTDNELEELLSYTWELNVSFNPLFEVFPFVTRIPPFRGKVQRWLPVAGKYEQFMMNKIEQSRQSDNANNFVQQYIEMSTSTGYNVKELAFILRDLLTAGSETVATSVAWALVILGNRPNILDKLQKEIDSVVPKERLPSLYDKNNLPYLEATMLEIWRYKTTSTLGAPHSTTCDTSVAGYDVPRNTTVLINLWGSHMDPVIWKDPETFRPERFLDDNMTIINQDLVIVFSLGKRSCLGEILARQEMFLTMAAIFQQFNILPPEGQTNIREEDMHAAVLAPAPYELRMVPRL